MHCAGALALNSCSSGCSLRGGIKAALHSVGTLQLIMRWKGDVHTQPAVHGKYNGGVQGKCTRGCKMHVRGCNVQLADALQSSRTRMPSRVADNYALH